MKHVPFTHKILEDWAGRPTFKTGMQLFEAGKVEKVQYDHPFISGQLAIGIRGMRSKFEVLSDGFVENHCPCRENRDEGRICAHLVALGLEAVRLYSDPERELKAAEEQRRAERLAEFDDDAYHTRDPKGTHTTLRLTLKQSWRDQLFPGKVTLRCAAEINGNVIPLNEVDKQLPLALNQQDDNLLFVLEDISGGPAKGKIDCSLSDLINLLDLRQGDAIFEGGRDDFYMVSTEPLNTHLRVKLDDQSGELLLSIHTDANQADTFITAGGSGWVLENEFFYKLKTILPLPLREVYQDTVRIPHEAVPGFLKNELPLLRNVMPVESELSEDLLDLSPAKPGFRLVVEGDQTTLAATLYAQYNHTEVVVGKDSADDISIPSPEDLLEFKVRNPEAESAALEKLKPLGFRGHRGDMLTSIRGKKEVLNFLGTDLPRLRRSGWHIDLEGMIAAFMDQAAFSTPVVHVSSEGNGFFDVSYEYDTIGGSSLDETEIQRAINMGEAFVEKKGRVILLDTVAIEEMREVFSDCAVGEGAEPGSFKMNDIHAGYVQNALAALDGVDVEDAPDWRQKASEQNRGAKVDPVPLGALENTLREYQKQGVYWMRFLERSGFCGILADEMGLGKTLQTLTWLQLERHRAEATGKPALIVCPTSLVDNWAEEAAKFTPDMRVTRLHGADRHERWGEVPESDLIITSYALIRRDLDAYLKHEFSVMALDEAQHIKNRTTQNAEAVKKVRALHKLVLTGTPIENSVADLWSIMDFLMPGYLGNHKAFREHYELPIKAGGPDAEMAQNKLRRKLHPFLMRRLKKEVAKDLPEKIQRVAQCALSPDQLKVYKQYAEAAKKEISQMVSSQGFNKSRMEILKTLLRLRQTCCHLDLLKLPGLQSQYPSAKLELFFELVDEALDAGHRILVFSQFTSMLAIIKEALEERELKYCYIDGSTKTRQEQVHEFNTNKSIPLFLISLKAGGSGLNLTGADMVIHFDPWWNPAVEDQATDRAHRIGQKKTVYSIKLITKGTVEEKVLQMQQKKQSVISATLEQDAEVAQSLTWDDVQELLSI